MRRPIRLLCAAAFILASGEAPRVAAAFGNTIVSTYPDRTTAEVWLRADGSYAREGRRHEPSSGHWRLKGDKICFHQEEPALFLISTFCTAMPNVAPGGTWISRAPTGERTTVHLARGITRGP